MKYSLSRRLRALTGQRFVETLFRLVNEERLSVSVRIWPQQCSLGPTLWT